jgi:AcrR family transcriptional regulator
MPTRLSARDRRRQILDVASGIFARKGYQGATTREIAEEAGVNEALLFRHFPTKEALYWTMLEELCLAGRRHDRMKTILDEGESDLEVFQAIARETLFRTARDRELTRLLWFTALENHELSVRFFNTFVAGYFEDLAGYIRTRIRQGVFRKVDPLLAARGFLGMVVYHFLVQELFGGEQYCSFDLEEVAHTLSGIWLAGMLNPVTPRGLRRFAGVSNGTRSRHPEMNGGAGEGRNGHPVRAGKKVKT